MNSPFAPSGKCTVLVVDDTPDNLSLMSDLLRTDYKVVPSDADIDRMAEDMVQKDDTVHLQNLLNAGLAIGGTILGGPIGGSIGSSLGNLIGGGLAPDSENFA